MTSLKKRTAKPVQLSLDAALVQRLDAAAETAGVPRSRVVEHAVEQFLEVFERDARAEKLKNTPGGAR